MCFAKQADPPPIQQPASIADPQVQAAGNDAKKRARAAAGAQSTILSTLMQGVGSNAGNQAANMGAKQLMGQ